jgi:hypothetical protein
MVPLRYSNPCVGSVDIRLGRKSQNVTYALAYYDTVVITPVKGCIVTTHPSVT